MAGYFRENPEWAATMSCLNARATKAHNACHDWLIDNPLARKVPDEMHTELMIAERLIDEHRKRERERYFEDLAKEHPTYIKPKTGESRK